MIKGDKSREGREILKERKGFGKIEQVFSVDPSKGPSAELSLEEVESLKKPSSMMTSGWGREAGQASMFFLIVMIVLSTVCEVQGNIKMQGRNELL